MAQCKCGAINEYQEEPYTCRDCRNDGVLPKPITDPPMLKGARVDESFDLDRTRNIAEIDAKIVALVTGGSFNMSELGSLNRQRAELLLSAEDRHSIEVTLKVLESAAQAARRAIGRAPSILRTEFSNRFWKACE